MSAFIISKRINDEYKFEFTSRRGKVIFTSNNFELKFECEDEIEFLKATVGDAVFLKFKSSRGKFFFRLIIHDKEMAISENTPHNYCYRRGLMKLLNTHQNQKFSIFPIMISLSLMI